jgi:hypothetical protein
MGASTIPASGAGGGLAPKYQKFTSSGTFTLPDGFGAAKPLLVNIQVIGGGGGGGTTGAVAYTFNGNGGWQNYFGEGWMNSGTTNSGVISTASSAGGSGGLCSTQLYLTANLTITVGAAGTRASATGNITNNENPMGGNFGNTGGAQYLTIPAGLAGGTGGTTTAGVLQATGGAGGYQSSFSYNIRYDDGSGDLRGKIPSNRFPNQHAAGVGGTPAGTAGLATPLLGTLAGGAASTTPVRGSFGIGGVYGDGTTSTGAEGTGGGFFAAGATGAVILTWWQ